MSVQSPAASTSPPDSAPVRVWPITAIMGARSFSPLSSYASGSINILWNTPSIPNTLLKNARVIGAVLDRVEVLTIPSRQ